MREHDEIMCKTTLSQISDYIKNGEPSDIEAIIGLDKDHSNPLEKIEDMMEKILNQEDANRLMDEVSNTMFRIENLAFQHGVRAGAKLLKELLQI